MARVDANFSRHRPDDLFASPLRARLKMHSGVAQATRLYCLPIHRDRTEWRQSFVPIAAAFSQSHCSTFRSARPPWHCGGWTGRQPGRASRPCYPFFRHVLREHFTLILTVLRCFRWNDSGCRQFLPAYGAPTKLRPAKAPSSAGRLSPTRSRAPATRPYVAGLLLVCCGFCCTFNACLTTM
jgi:hypothetical protein